MIEFRTLGAVALHDTGGRGSSGMPTQPKRVALLAYLTIAGSDRLIRRDTLTAMFWADSDERRGRLALRQALRYLRQALGAGVIVTRGEEEVGVASGELVCDATAFRRALCDGDDAGALALYGGELLPGLYVNGSRPFEQWLEMERAQLRTAARDATVRLAAAAESAANLAGAIAWLRRGLELEPADETIARRLVALLERSGQRAAAMSFAAAFERRLREEYGIESGGEVTAAGTAASATPADGSNAEPADPLRISVGRFVNRTGDATLDALGTMAAEQIAQELTRVPDVQVVMSNAGTRIDGAYDGDGDSVRFHVIVTDANANRLMRAPEPVRVATAAPLPGLDELRRRTAAVLAPQLNRRVVHAQHGTQPPSHEAYRAYADGLEHFVRLDWAGALRHFRRAASLEPEYALPRIACAIAHWNLSELPAAAAAAAEAERLRSLLTGFEAAVLDMVQAWLCGDWMAAYDACARQAELAPGSIPHFQVAEEARRLNRPREARSILSRLDPTTGELRGFVFYWTELAATHHLLGDHLRELECTERANAIHGDHPVVRLMQVRAHAALGRTDALDRLLDDALATPDQREPRAGLLLREAALELRTHMDDGVAAPYFAAAVAWCRDRPAAERRSVAGRRELARTLYHAGEYDEAASIFAALADSGPHPPALVTYHHGHLQAHLDEGYLAVCAVRRSDAAAGQHWCDRLEELDGPFLFGAQRFWLAAAAALKGEREVAVSQLRRAFAEGLPYEHFLHTDPHLALLRGYAPFEALVRPRG